jgi:hypothetical protein
MECPASVARDQNRAEPRVRRNPLLGTRSDKPNADADCF